MFQITLVRLERLYVRMAMLLALLLCLLLLLAPLPARAVDLSVDGNLRLNCGTATATAGAATLANKCGKVTSEALTTATAAVYTLTVTATGAIAAADHCYASINNGTNTQGATMVQRVTPGANSLVVLVKNVHASEALNGTIVVSYLCHK